MSGATTSTTPKKRTVELPPVAARLEITSLQDYVEAVFEHVARAKLDLGDDKQREGLQKWVLHLIEGYLQHLEWDLSKGADRGIRQVLHIARDPDYYQTAKRRRQRQRQRQQADTVTVAASPPVRTLGQGVELATLPFGIYRHDPGDEDDRPELVYEADALDLAEKWVAREFGRRLRTNGSERIEIVRMSDRQIVKELSFT